MIILDDPGDLPETYDLAIPESEMDEYRHVYAKKLEAIFQDEIVWRKNGIHYSNERSLQQVLADLPSDYELLVEQAWEDALDEVWGPKGVNQP